MSNRPMSSRLPELIDPLRLADKNALLDGTLPIDRLKRLAPSLANTDGDLRVNVQFGYDECGQAFITGSVEVVVAVVCQRCMQIMSWHSEVNISLALITHEDQAEKLADRYEPLLIGEDTQLLAEILEDEILLGFPNTNVHSIEECPEGSQFIGQETDVDESQENKNPQAANKRKNPFAVLETLKVKK